MIASTQIRNIEIFAAIVFKWLSRKVLFFKKIANFTDKLLQNYKQLQTEIFRILFKHVSDHLSVLFQFVWLYL